MIFFVEWQKYWIFAFFSLFQIGSFFMINLCLVVIATQFSETKKRETERMMQERKRFQSSSTLASNSEPGGCYDEILKYIAHLFRRARRKVMKAYKQAQGRRQRKVNPERAISLRRKTKKNSVQTVHLHHHHHHHHHHYHLGTSNNSDGKGSPKAPRASPEVSDIDPVSSPRRPNHLGLPGVKSTNPSTDSLQTITFTDALAPAVAKSQQSSPNHLMTTVSISRTSSFNSAGSGGGGGGGGGGKSVSITPEVLAVHGAKNAALAASNTLLNTDCDVNKLNPSKEKGKSFSKLFKWFSKKEKFLLDIHLV